MKEGMAVLWKGLRKYDREVYELLTPHINDGVVLSIGCGEGRVEKMFVDRKKIKVLGVEVTKYKNAHIPVKLYNGIKLPFRNKSFDTTIFVYVLHHTNNIESLLREASRVTKNEIIILEHTYSNMFSKQLLKFYDYSTNMFYRMPIPYNFLKVGEWFQLFRRTKLKAKGSYIISPFNVFFKLEC